MYHPERETVFLGLSFFNIIARIKGSCQYKMLRIMLKKTELPDLTNKIQDTQLKLNFR